MKTPFDLGKEAGHWTLEKLAEIEWESASVCLEHYEEWYKGSIENLSRLYQRNPEKARREAEFEEGLINEARKTLKTLIEQGY